MKWQTDGVNVDKDIWSKHRWLAYQFQSKHTVKAALVTQNSHRKTEAGGRWMDCWVCISAGLFLKASSNSNKEFKLDFHSQILYEPQKNQN